MGFRPSQKLRDTISQVKDPKLRKVLSNGHLFLEESAGSGNASLTPDPNAPVSQTAQEKKQEAKCTLSGPNCPKIREKFTNLAGEVWDSLNELKIMLNNLNLHCSETQKAISAMV